VAQWSDFCSGKIKYSAASGKISRIGLARCVRIPSMYTEFIRAEIMWHKEAHVVLYLWAANKKPVCSPPAGGVCVLLCWHRILCFICMHIKHSDVASVGESQHDSPLS
jgi:hypothetical protein